VKTVAFSSAGKVLGERSCSYSMLHPMPGWSEQDPEEIAGAVFKCVENILQHFRHPPQLISFSAAMHSLIAVDEEGLPLSNCLIWADNRADGIAGRIIREQRAESYY
jgi:gluconokinase